MIVDATRMCQLLVGLPQVTILGVVDGLVGTPIVVHIETESEVPERCTSRSTFAAITGVRRCRWSTSRRSVVRSGWYGTSAVGGAR